LLTAAGLALWGSFRKTSRFVHAVRAVRWLAGALLLIGTLSAWQGNLPASAAHLILMTTLAALPGRRHYPHWGSALSILPVLVLVGASLLWRTDLARVETEASDLLTAVIELAIVVCGGLGARALSQNLGESTAPPQRTGRPALPTAATYALLTFLLSSTALINLWQRGAMWRKATYEGGLAGAWLAWSAVWLSLRYPRWLRTVLMIAATSILVALAAK
jgi:hypothetical protein